MKLLLLLPLLFLFPPTVHAQSTIHVESRAENGGSATSTVYSNTQSTSTNTNTTQSNTHIYTNVNGKVEEYNSDQGGDVTVENNGKTSSVTVNGKAAKYGTVTTTPAPSLTQDQIKAKQIELEAKIKADAEKAKQKLEAEKKAMEKKSFDMKKFFEDLFKRIFHF